jgi:DNA phosphorothioation-dependent restriction protein DptF
MGVIGQTSAHNELSLKEIFKNYLRVSSKNAVIDGEKAIEDPVKQYLNIRRSVDNQFKELVRAAAENDKPCLILLIGNVGDGKSHLLASLKNECPEINEFKIHNDATASYNRTKTYIDSLDELLAPFEDDKIGSKSAKIILAINLGTLANYLDAKQNSFKTLKKYIDQQNIFSEQAQKCHTYNADSFFQSLNLTDYHLFSLTNNEPVSYLIDSLFDKLTDANGDNPFYNVYSSFYQGKAWAGRCPIKFNYEFLSRPEVKSKICKIIIEAIVRNKLVVSVRELLNFIYDILVPVSLANMSERDYESYILELTPEKYISLLMPNHIFEHPEGSNLLKATHRLDPMLETTEIKDNILLDPHKEAKKTALITKNEFMNGNIESLSSITISKFITRINFFLNCNSYTKNFEDYIKLLFLFQNGDKDSVKRTYSDSINALAKWNGNNATNQDLFPYDKLNQHKFRIMSKIELKPSELPVNQEKDTLSRFNLYFLLKFQGLESPFKMDFDLFVLFQKIKKGYVPNYIDKRNHINVQKYIELAMTVIGTKSEVFVKEQDYDKKYCLNIDEYGDYSFKEVLG